MNVAAPEFIREALDLPEEARADLAHRFLESRPTELPLGEESLEFMAELDRRAVELLSGHVIGLSWDDAQRELSKTLRARDES